VLLCVADILGVSAKYPEHGPGNTEEVEQNSKEESDNSISGKSNTFDPFMPLPLC